MSAFCACGRRPARVSDYSNPRRSTPASRAGDGYPRPSTSPGHITPPDTPARRHPRGRGRARHPRRSPIAPAPTTHRTHPSATHAAVTQQTRRCSPPPTTLFSRFVDPACGAPDGSGECSVAPYELCTSPEIRGRMAMQKALSGLSTRRHPIGLEPVRQHVTETSSATSTSAVSRRL